MKNTLGITEQPHEKLNRLADSLEADAITMRRKLDELEPVVLVVINGDSINIDSRYFDLTLQELVDANIDNNNEKRLTAYLMSKYDGYNGVPKQCLDDEILTDNMTAIHNWIKEELEVTSIPEFIPFSLVASIVTHKMGN